jgi:hypothetical protein
MFKGILPISKMVSFTGSSSHADSAVLLGPANGMGSMDSSKPVWPSYNNY